MTDPMRGAHPDSADLQRLADGESDVGEEAVAHVESCAECRAEIDRIQRVTAALSLSSRAPASLAVRIASKRAAAAPLRATPSAYRRPRFLLPIGLAAAAVLVMLMPWAWREVRSDRTVSTAEKGIPIPWPNRPTPIPRSLFHGLISDVSPSTLDSAVVVMETDSLSGINLRYDGMHGDSAAARQLAERARAYVMSRGVEPGKIRVHRNLIETRGPMPPGGVQVLVWTTAPRFPSEKPQRKP